MTIRKLIMNQSANFPYILDLSGLLHFMTTIDYPTMVEVKESRNLARKLKPGLCLLSL